MPEPKAKKNTFEIWSILSGVVVTLISGLASIWSTVVAIYDTLSAVWSVVKDFVQPLWDAFNSAYDWMKSTIWPSVLELYASVKSVYDWADGIFKDLNKFLDTTFNSVFGEIFKVWNSIAGVEQKLTTLISTFDKELAQQIDQGFKDFRAETLGVIESYYRLAKSYVEDVRRATLGRVKPYIDLIGSTIHTVESTLTQFSSLMNKAFEGPVRLKDDVVRETTRRYGMTMWNELFGYTLKETTPPPDPSGIEISIFPDLEDQIVVVDQGDTGPWADVSTNIDEWIAFVDGSGPEPEFGLDKSTLTPDEAKNLDIYEEAAVERFPEPPPPIEEKPEDVAPVAPEIPSYEIPSFNDTDIP
jgi:hypothetical protein